MVNIVGVEEEASESRPLDSGINLFAACLMSLIASDVLGWIFPRSAVIASSAESALSDSHLGGVAEVVVYKPQLSRSLL